MRLSDDGRYLGTFCEGGQYLRIWGWFENETTGEMEPPMSLYMFEVDSIRGGGQIIDIQFSQNMNMIATSILTTEKR